MDSDVPNSSPYDNNKKPHAICIPYPAQGHINPMFKLAKFLHFKGFHITFVHTEYNYKRSLKSRDSSFVVSSKHFQFETIPDGLPPSEISDSTQDIPSLSDSTSKNCLEPLINLIYKLNDTEGPPVTCIVSDGAMSFSLDAAERFGLPCVLFWTLSACGGLAYTQFRELIGRGLFPLKDESYLRNGYLETTVDWIPGMKNIRLKDLPSFIRTTDPNDIMVNYIIREIERARQASAVVLNTFDALEKDVLDALSSTLPNLCAIGPLQLLLYKIAMTDEYGCGNPIISTTSSTLWKEDADCLEWLDSQEPNSVVYVNFGSITTMTPEQLVEFAWGLANSGKSFLWIIRSDLVEGNTAILPQEFVAETHNRAMLAGWCAQEQVLNHPAIGIFLTHCGWNSTLESICSGVPILCWPFFAEQQLNCLYSTREWGIGLEIGADVGRDEMEKMLRELMDGNKGVEMKKKAMEWKKMAEEAIKPGGSSYENLEKLLSEFLL